MSSANHCNIAVKVEGVEQLLDPTGHGSLATAGSLVAVVQVPDSEKDEHELMIEFDCKGGKWVPRTPSFVVPDVHLEQSVMIQLYYLPSGSVKETMAKGEMPDEVGLMNFPASHLPACKVKEGENREASWTQVYHMGATTDGQTRAMMTMGMDAQMVTEADTAFENFAKHSKKSEIGKGRLLDLDDDPQSHCTPIKGVMSAERLGLVEAAAATGMEVSYDASEALETGKRLADGDPYGLEPDEAGAIVLYTMETPVYPTMNRLLRTEARAELRPFFPYIRLLLDAKKKIEKKHKCVWRGVKGDLRSQYPEGTEVFWWAFSSTTKQLHVLQSPMFLGTEGERTLFMIEAKNGVDIQRYSAIPGENELLLFPGTKLKIKAALDLGSGLYQVHMQEMDVPEDLIA